MHETVCLFCALPGAYTTLTGEPWALHQYGCGTVQMLHALTGEVLSSHRTPGCQEIVRLQEQLEERKRCEVDIS